MMKNLYTARVTAKGGRSGKVKSDNGVLELDMRIPKALGGANDDFANPEMLFAAGYSACFDSALNLVIDKLKIKTGVTTVISNVSIGKINTDGFGLAVKLEINIPDISLEEANSLAERAHQICPYSNAIKNNVDVELVVTNV